MRLRACWKRSAFCNSYCDRVHTVLHPLLSQKSHYRRGEFRWCFHIRQMGCWQLHILRLGDAFGEKFSLSRRRDRVIGPGDNQSRDLDLMNHLSLVHVADCGAPRHISCRVRRDKHLAGTSDYVRRILLKGGGKPAVEHQWNCRPNSALEYKIDASVPALRGADLRRSIAEHQLSHPVGGIRAQPLTDRSTHRKPTKIATLDSQGVEQRYSVPSELINTVRSRRH